MKCYYSHAYAHPPVHQRVEQHSSHQNDENLSLFSHLFFNKKEEKKKKGFTTYQCLTL